ncbi:hypothetical protein Syun_000740 [Stephania yunnanensis]|uniref:Uncharacterized protein n=1 Tax=Stephania yunnanensis TaxID=152371 RepID=A0AAP0LFC8_9MAGN
MSRDLETPTIVFSPFFFSFHRELTPPTTKTSSESMAPIMLVRIAGVRLAGVAPPPVAGVGLHWFVSS